MNDMHDLALTATGGPQEPTPGVGFYPREGKNLRGDRFQLGHSPDRLWAFGRLTLDRNRGRRAILQTRSRQLHGIVYLHKVRGWGAEKGQHGKILMHWIWHEAIKRGTGEKHPTQCCVHGRQNNTDGCSIGTVHSFPPRMLGMDAVFIYPDTEQSSSIAAEWPEHRPGRQTVALFQRAVLQTYRWASSRLQERASPYQMGLS